jgi:hypothetical protein
VIAGTPALATAVVAPPATFAMNAGTATAVDPEGDAINYLITAGTAPNGPFPSAAGQAALPIPGLGPYPTPGVVAFTVHARDPLHGNTAVAQPDSTSQYAVVNGTVAVPCPGLAYAGTNVLGNYSTFSANAWTINSCNQPSMDFVAMTNTSFDPSGGVLHQTTGPTVGILNDIVLCKFGAGSNSGTLSVNTSLNSAAAGLTKRVHQIEVDPTVTTGTRVIFAQLNAGFVGGGAFTYLNPTSLYAATGADPNFYWYDWTVLLTPATAFNTVSTGTDRVMCMTVNEIGDVFFIDQNHILHRRIKASAYAEDTSAPYPMNLASVIGTNAGAGDSNRKLNDLIYDTRNKCFFIMVNSQGPAVAPGNTLIYRVECDGVVNATIGGNPNPLRTVINNDTAQSQFGDLSIDERSTTGAILASQGEAQILLSGQSGNFMWAAMNSNMLNYVNQNIYGAQGHTVSLLNNIFYGNYVGGGGTSNLCYGGVPPTSWQ